MTVDMQSLARALDDLEWWDDAEALRALVAENQRLRDVLQDITANFDLPDVAYDRARAALDGAP